MARLVRIAAGAPGGEPDYQRALAEVASERAVLVGEARNSRCYRVESPWGPWLVKRPTDHDRTNPDRSYLPEFTVVERAWALGLPAIPRPVALLDEDGEGALVLGYAPGRPFCEADLREPVLAALVEVFGAWDRAGLGHYDLQPSNVLVDGDTVHGIDFEFARFAAIDEALAGGPAYLDDFNAGPNPRVPWRPNATNFEFRALSHWPGADLSGWWRLRAEGHRRWAHHLRELAEGHPEGPRLRDGAEVEEALARALVRPEVQAVEVALGQCRDALFRRVRWEDVVGEIRERLAGFTDPDGLRYARTVENVVARLWAKELALRSIEAW